MITTGTATSTLDFEGELTSADPALGRVIAAVVGRIGQQRITSSRATPFEAMVRAIVYQSVSGKAAAVIFARLKQAVGGTVSPAKILGISEDSVTSGGPIAASRQFTSGTR